MPAHPKHVLNGGFTLIQSTVTLCVVSIVLSTAVPSLGDVIAANRLTTELNLLTSFFYTARSEAVMRGRRATVCPTTQGDKCLGSRDWALGYMVFIDEDADRRRDPTEPLVRLHAVATDAVRINAGRRKTVSYLPDGSAPGSNLTITFCDNSGRVPPKALVVSMSGRSRVTGVHPNGEELTCP